ncbi:MAG: hypothetical protein PHV82_07405 [Victivallaceae bacterium]|nr:hypothetical protein [Victivallaceae bacterium]
MSSDTQNLKVGPCSITYKGELLGITRNSSVLSFKFSHYDVKVNRTHEQIIDKRLTGIHIYFKTEIVQIDKGVSLLLNENKNWTLDDLGKRWSPLGGELLIVPISANDKIAYRMPNALIVNQGVLNFSNTEAYTLQMEFESNYNDGEEILIETLDADTCGRTSLEDNSIDSDSFEFAMTAYIADKLGMTVDTDIFRGGIPLNVDGCGVELVGYEEDDLMAGAKYFVSFFCLAPSRKTVMKNIKSLADKFPAYGETITLKDSGDLTCLAITKGPVEFGKRASDDGKIKSFGELLLKISI